MVECYQYVISIQGFRFTIDDDDLWNRYFFRWLFTIYAMECYQYLIAAIQAYSIHH